MNNKVLIVDDDANVLETYRTILTGSSQASNWLSELGELIDEPDETTLSTELKEHNLLMCDSGEAAIQLHANKLSQGEQIAVALVDMRMPPGMNGLETAVALRKQDPNIYIVIITAYSDYNIDEIQSALQHDFILLSKPIDPEEFRQITRNAIVSYHRFIHLKHPVDFPLGSVLQGDQVDIGRVLVVDNDPVTQQYCATLLRKQCGYEVFLAQSGQEALDQVLEMQPDLILMDVMMPGMNGYEVCGRLKSNPETSSIPVIFITARGEEEDIITGFHVGGADYVTKPFSQEVLLARVTTHLNQFKNRRRGETLSRNRLLKVMRSLNEGMIVTDRRGVITEVNSVVVRMTRQSRDQLVGRAVSTLFEGEEGREPLFVFNEERVQRLQLQLQRLFESRLLYFEQLIDDAPLGVLQLSQSGEVIKANHRALQLLEQDVAIVEGRTIDEFLPGFSALSVENEQGIEQVLQLKLPEGKLQMLPVRVSYFTVEKEDEEKRVLVVIRQQEYDLDGTLLCLTAFGQLFAAESQGREWVLHRAGGGTSPVLLQGGVYRDEFHHVEGGVLTLTDLRERKRLESQEQYSAFQSGVAEMSANILHNIGNSIQGVSTGINQLKRQQENLEQLIESLEQFQQLDLDAKERARRQQALIEELPTALRKLTDEESNSYSALSSAGLVEHGITHISEIIQLHRQGFKIDQQAVKTNLYHLLDDALMLTGERIKKRGIRFRKELNLEETVYLVPRNQLLQALINVIINATDAVTEQFPDGDLGEIQISMEQLQRESKPWVSIVVKDDGVGITSEQQERVLEFGYSTKQRGSGFGLHATANFLRGLDGEILIESGGVGEGTTITLLFPAL